MIDQADMEIAKQLADRHMYPYAKDIYQSIFTNFSHFPIKLNDIHLNLSGATITVIAWAVQSCIKIGSSDFGILNRKVSEKIREKIPAYFPQDPAIDILLGCVLYFYHPSKVRSALSALERNQGMDSQKQYEFQLKKRTLHIHIV